MSSLIQIQPGERFHRWTVVQRAGFITRMAAYKCRCDCGTEKVIRSDALRRTFRPSLSCGCARRDSLRKHGASRTSRLYKVWTSARSRCRNANDKKFHRYGGRGIVFDSRWDDFAVFARDMGPRPAGMSLDRIDNDGPYSPDNCRWATRQQQADNSSFARGCPRKPAADLSDSQIRRRRRQMMRLNQDVA